MSFALIHDTVERHPDRVRAALRMRARAEHHLPGAAPVAEALAALAPFMRIKRIETFTQRDYSVRPTGAVIVISTDGVEYWVGQAHHSFVIKGGHRLGEVVCEVKPLSEAEAA